MILTVWGLNPTTQAVRCLVFSPTQRGKRPVLVSASDDGSVQLWDSVTHELKHSFLRMCRSHQHRIASGLTTALSSPHRRAPFVCNRASILARE